MYIHISWGIYKQAQQNGSCIFDKKQELPTAQAKNVYMHAKLLQSCPTLYDPMDCSLPGTSVHGILQARILEWVAMSTSRGLPNPGIEPAPLMSPALQADSLPLVPPGKPKRILKACLSHNTN